MEDGEPEVTVPRLEARVLHGAGWGQEIDFRGPRGTGGRGWGQ